ncbi:helix-turn-helix domain-containing protein [Microvirga lenta]|uniref:helix-turn-helix domain-containing protein n=1 Tax=Microvirga lenta TaxID=2881337 RepID=UPI001CFF790F|nr:helix-turn-helix domain-containing protein [Microvirga lenta]MCB5177087.1 helix-turn-helix domain-containing protein [Microvirga lenta]
MAGIPTYSLYGEFKEDTQSDWIHCETIQARSRLHNYEIQPHRHESLFQILHLECGQAELVLDGRRNRLDAPCIVTLPAMVVHGYTFSPDVEGTVLTLFEGRLPHVLRSAGGTENSFREVQLLPLSEHPTMARSIAADIAEIATEFEAQAPCRLGAIEARLALVLIAVHRMSGLALQTSHGPGSRSLQHALRFRQLVDRDYRTHQPLDTYARRLGVTPTHLNRICREHLGDTALGIIHQRIVIEAKRYLTFSSLSAKEIALALAFDDPAYFTRFFKNRTGLSPLEFRHRQRSTAA